MSAESNCEGLLSICTSNKSFHVGTLNDTMIRLGVEAGEQFAFVLWPHLNVSIREQKTLLHVLHGVWILQEYSKCLAIVMKNKLAYGL